MPDDRPSDQRPRWNRGRLSRLRSSSRGNAAARPWYADRLEQRSEARAARTPLGPYETAYDVSEGYAFDRREEPRR